jgi:hypothetical protein
MRHDEYPVRITTHAHQQYCDRVKHIDYIELNRLCEEQLHTHNYDYREKQFIRLNGVWWVFKIEDGCMVFITCYGQSHYHIPKALAWAARNNDRIDLYVVRS